MTGNVTATAQPAQTGISAFFGRFDKQFWVVNTFELFERGAFYTMMAIFTYHFIYNVGIKDSIMGTALAVQMFLLYFVPIIASALASRIGYKVIFIFSFILIILGYITYWQTRTVSSLFIGILALGIGAGCFKPMVSATIAHVTKEKDRNFGYSIYYWMINLGAFVFPFVVGYYIENVLQDTKLYAIAFLISSVLVVVNLVICLIFFKDPVARDPNKNVLAAIKNLGVIVQDRKFFILLIIYAGFWFMYSLNMSFLPVYMVDFGLKPDWFAVTWIGVINPGTIILVGPFLGKAVDKISDKFSSVQIMMAGISIYILGMTIMSFVKSFYACAFGIIVFSFGEFITHPNFISYVSKLAPKDKVTVYLGYAFIPVGIGNTLGSVVSGYLYEYFAVDLHKPTMFWSIVTCVGILTVACFLIYNKYVLGGINQVFPDSQPKSVSDTPAVEAKPLGFGTGRLMNMKIMPVLVILMIPVLLGSAMGVPADNFYRPKDCSSSEMWNVTSITLTPVSGSSDENSDQTIVVNITDENVLNVTFTLRWTDEPAPYPRYVNQPDEFAISVSGPDGAETSGGPTSNTVGSEGEVSATITREGPELTKLAATGDYNVTISMGAAGDSKLPRTPGLVVFTDSGNEWTLEITYEFVTVTESAC